MSIVSSYASDTAEAALKRQRRTATVSSLIISVLVVVLLGLILALILLPGLFTESATIVSYNGREIVEEEITKPEMTPQVQRKPSAPSSSMAKVIASVTPSPTAIPVPDVNVPDPRLISGPGMISGMDGVTAAAVEEEGAGRPFSDSGPTRSGSPT